MPNTIPPITPADRARFERLFPVRGDGCWIAANKPGKRGYVAVSWHSEDWTAHRLSWAFHFGPIPDGQYVCHTCDVPTCGRPDHLFLGTHQENMADMGRKGRASPQGGERQSAKTQCPAGHEYSEENTWIDGDGHRQCRVCHNLKQQQRYAEGAAKPAHYVITHCVHGHEYTPENTYTRRDNSRACRTCHRERQRAAARVQS